MVDATGQDAEPPESASGLSRCELGAGREAEKAEAVRCHGTSERGARGERSPETARTPTLLCSRN